MAKHFKRTKRKMYLTETVNEALAVENWAEQIKDITGVTDPKKLDWMSAMCESLRINDAKVAKMKAENEGYKIDEDGYGSQTPAFIGGQGEPTLPDIGSGTGAFFDPAYKEGSGDTPSLKLITAMKVAAQTPGLELLPSIPMERRTAFFTFIDAVFAGGSIDSEESAPLYVSLRGGTGAITASVANTLEEGKEYGVFGLNVAGDAPLAGDGFTFTFIKKGRFGDIIIKPSNKYFTTDIAGALTAKTSKLEDIVAVGHAKFGVFELTSATQLDLTAANIDNLGVSITIGETSVTDEDVPHATNRTGITSDSMTGAEGEKGTTNSITLRRFSRSVEARERSIEAHVTHQQEYDFAVDGINTDRELHEHAQSAISRAITQEILNTMFRLGVTAAAELFAAQGINLNLFIGTQAESTKAFTDFSYAEFKDINGVDRAAEFGSIANSEANTSAENLHTRQRRLASVLLLARNLIGVVGRHGRADFAVMGAHLASALEDNAKFQACPADNDFAENGDNMYYIGRLRGLDLYVNPIMQWNDDRILIGRRGNDDDPGLKFMPYVLSTEIKTLSETSMSKKLLISSRYAIVPAGFFPQYQYLTVCVNSGFGTSSWAM